MKRRDSVLTLRHRGPILMGEDTIMTKTRKPRPMSPTVPSVTDRRPAVAYIRVSTDRQATEGVSLEAQEARLRAWAVANGAELVSVHVDPGLSGGRAYNRPELQAALEDACRLRAPLVFYSLSRVARSTMDTLAIADRLERAGADLVSLTESIDTTTAAGKMVFRMLAVLAEFERDLVSERTSAAMAYLRTQGQRISGQIPFGYDLLEEGRLVPNVDEQETLVLVRRLRDEGRSLRAIAAELEARGIRTKTGGSTWAPKVLAGVLGRVAA